MKMFQLMFLILCALHQASGIVTYTTLLDAIAKAKFPDPEGRDPHEILHNHLVLNKLTIKEAVDASTVERERKINDVVQRYCAALGIPYVFHTVVYTEHTKNEHLFIVTRLPSYDDLGGNIYHGTKNSRHCKFGLADPKDQKKYISFDGATPLSYRLYANIDGWLEKAYAVSRWHTTTDFSDITFQGSNTTSGKGKCIARKGDVFLLPFAEVTLTNGKRFKIPNTRSFIHRNRLIGFIDSFNADESCVFTLTGYVSRYLRYNAEKSENKLHGKHEHLWSYTECDDDLPPDQRLPFDQPGVCRIGMSAENVQAAIHCTKTFCRRDKPTESGQTYEQFPRLVERMYRRLKLGQRTLSLLVNASDRKASLFELHYVWGAYPNLGMKGSALFWLACAVKAMYPSAYFTLFDEARGPYTGLYMRYENFFRHKVPHTTYYTLKLQDLTPAIGIFKDVTTPLWRQEGGGYEKAAALIQQFNTAGGLKTFMERLTEPESSSKKNIRPFRVFKDHILKNKYGRELLSLILDPAVNELSDSESLKSIQRAFNSLQGKWESDRGAHITVTASDHDEGYTVHITTKEKAPHKHGGRPRMVSVTRKFTIREEADNGKRWVLIDENGSADVWVMNGLTVVTNPMNHQQKLQARWHRRSDPETTIVWTPVATRHTSPLSFPETALDGLADRCETFKKTHADVVSYCRGQEPKNFPHKNREQSTNLLVRLLEVITMWVGVELAGLPKEFLDLAGSSRKVNDYKIYVHPATDFSRLRFGKAEDPWAMFSGERFSKEFLIELTKTKASWSPLEPSDPRQAEYANAFNAHLWRVLNGGMPQAGARRAPPSPGASTGTSLAPSRSFSRNTRSTSTGSYPPSLHSERSLSRSASPARLGLGVSNMLQTGHQPPKPQPASNTKPEAEPEASLLQKRKTDGCDGPAAKRPRQSSTIARPQPSKAPQRPKRGKKRPLTTSTLTTSFRERTKKPRSVVSFTSVEAFVGKLWFVEFPGKVKDRRYVEVEDSGRITYHRAERGERMEFQCYTYMANGALFKDELHREPLNWELNQDASTNSPVWEDTTTGESAVWLETFRWPKGFPKTGLGLASTPVIRYERLLHTAPPDEYHYKIWYFSRYRGGRWVAWHEDKHARPSVKVRNNKGKPRVKISPTVDNDTLQKPERYMSNLSEKDKMFNSSMLDSSPDVDAEGKQREYRYSYSESTFWVATLVSD